MKQPTPAGQAGIDKLFEDLHLMGITEFSEEYANHGVCYHCGNVQSGVEPDAEQYTCEECAHDTVMGIELALLRY